MAVGKQFDEENGYDSSREIAFYMQQVAKEAGVTEEELAAQILAEEEAAEEAEVDDSEALQQIGLWDRFKSAVKTPFTSMSDWADSHDAQWKTAMVQAMFGDTAPMNSYYQQQKQMEEAQKNREFQAEQARLNREAQQNYNEILAGKESDTEAKERKRQLAAVELGDELKDKIESGEMTRDEAQVKAHAAFREGKLTYQELKDIRGIIEGKTVAEEKAEVAGKKAEAKAEEAESYALGQGRKDNEAKKDLKRQIAAKKQLLAAEIYRSKKHAIQKEIDALEAQLKALK